MRPQSFDDFETAIICALPLEFDAVEALFDETYDNLETGLVYGKQHGDANWYRTGRIGQHNIVLMCLPGMGKKNAAAAAAASSLRASFVHVTIALVVGICGGIPWNEDRRIFLGDVIISDSVVEYDFGKQYPDRFQRRFNETLGRPNRDIRTFLVGLKTLKMHDILQGNLLNYLQDLQGQLGGRWQYPGVTHDCLFPQSSRHKHHDQGQFVQCICAAAKDNSDPVCSEALKNDCGKLGCRGAEIRCTQSDGKDPSPSVHFGALASGDIVMKSAEHRDRQAKEDNIIGFEMEGAAVCDILPSVIIKGVCDYADSHKDNLWQHYAAATAASCTKSFLKYWKSTTQRSRAPAQSTSSGLSYSDTISTSKNHIVMALWAFGLTGNAVKFVNLTGKLISVGNAFSKYGNRLSPPESLRKFKDRLRELRGLVTALGDQVTMLKENFEDRTGNAVLMPEDQYLVDLTNKCDTAGLQLLEYLDSLAQHLPPSMNVSPARNTFRCDHGKIGDFLSCIRKLQSALTLATSLALRSNATEYHESMSAYFKMLKRADGMHVSDDVETRVMFSLLMDAGQQTASPAFDDTRKHLMALISQQRDIINTREHAILRWLNFRQIPLRYEEISFAYHKTFSWVLRRPYSGYHENNFRSHLTGTDVIVPYFINGKAGSGKSTLMKFIVREPDTMEALREWAHEGELVVSKFFFWNLGTRLQKNHVGMLRALLYDILKAIPELIPVVFTDLYQNWKDTHADDEPTYVEMKMAFNLLKKRSAGFLKLCFFIDGIDELDGDHRDMALFLRSLASPHIKFVISSRPIAACVNAFKGCPTLKLQDLTRHDIALFIQGKLCSHYLMIGYATRFPREISRIVQTIRDKAEGVFLWVKLVVQLLTDGLEEGDNLEDLQGKLQSLPSDLRDLYRRMIGKMNPLYQRQAAEIFQIHHMWSVLIEEQPLRAAVLWYAAQHPDDAFRIPVTPLGLESLNWLTVNIEARIGSRCCGLLEVRKRTQAQGWARGNGRVCAFSLPIDELYGSTVSYLHRSVAEFFASSDVWEEICSMTEASGFGALLDLASACISMMKGADNFTCPGLLLDLTYTTKFLRKSMDMPHHILQNYIASIDRTMQEHQHMSIALQGAGFRGIDNHWSADLFSMETEPQNKFQQLANLDTFAARTGLLFILNHVPCA